MDCFRGFKHNLPKIDGFEDYISTRLKLPLSNEIVSLIVSKKSKIMIKLITSLKSAFF